VNREKCRGIGVADWPTSGGLNGEVGSEQYERLVAGQDPHTGEQLIRAVKARETVNSFGEEMTTSEHRAGWDATFSAPKSVSLAALVGDDERIRVAHRESADEALKEFEEYIQARGGAINRRSQPARW
jgi:conjugative relaxase-like TrwC/TraI family protein